MTLKTTPGEDIQEFIKLNETMTAYFDFEEFQHFESKKLGKIDKISNSADLGFAK